MKSLEAKPPGIKNLLLTSCPAVGLLAPSNATHATEQKHCRRTEQQKSGRFGHTRTLHLQQPRRPPARPILLNLLERPILGQTAEKRNASRGRSNRSTRGKPDTARAIDPEIGIGIAALVEQLDVTSGRSPPSSRGGNFAKRSGCRHAIWSSLEHNFENTRRRSLIRTRNIGQCADRESRQDNDDTQNQTHLHNQNPFWHSLRHRTTTEDVAIDPPDA